MDACDLTKKKCVPCEGGVPPLEGDAVALHLKAVPQWKQDGDKIVRDFKFKDFVENMAFVNKVAEVAEAEGHHPDLFIHGWNKLTVTLWTHAVGGLTENDFIVAAKVDAL